MRIIYQRINEHGESVLHVVHAAAKDDIELVLGEMTDDQYKAHVWERSVPADAIDPVEIADDYVLPSREFRNAWVKSDDKVEHDFTKVKEIQLERTRFDRDVLLSKYDGLQLRASDLEDAAEESRIKKIKQQLREATDSLKELTNGSVEDVKNAAPDLSKY